MFWVLYYGSICVLGVISIARDLKEKYSKSFKKNNQNEHKRKCGQRNG